MDGITAFLIFKLGLVLGVMALLWRSSAKLGQERRARQEAERAAASSDTPDTES